VTVGVSAATWWRDVKAEYADARSSIYRRQRSTAGPIGSGANYHYATEYEFFDRMERARDIQRTDPFVPQAVDRLVHNVIQDGIHPEPAAADQAVVDNLKGRYTEWCKAEHCDAHGEGTFADIQELALTQHIFDGDIFGIPLASGELLMRESHRVRTPKRTGVESVDVVHGISVNGRGRVSNVYVTKKDYDGGFKGFNIDEFDVMPAWKKDAHGEYRNIFQVLHRSRYGQRRGISTLARIFSTVDYCDDLHFATMVKAQMAACVVLKRELTPDGDPLDVEGTDREFSDSTTRKFEQMYPGMVLRAGRGESLDLDSANVPSPEYFRHSMLLASVIATNLRLPVAVMFLDPSNTNFSGWRGAIEQARVGWRDLQYLIRDRLVAPVWAWKVRQWMATDAALMRYQQRNGDIFRAKFRLPGWQYIQPEIDASADRYQVATLQTSARRNAAKRGQVYEEIVAEGVADNALAIRTAMLAHRDLVEEFPEQAGNLHWEQLLVLPVPDGLTLNLSKKDETNDADNSTNAGDTSTERTVGDMAASRNGRVGGTRRNAVAGAA